MAGEQSPGREECWRLGHRVSAASRPLHPSCSIPPSPSLPLPQAEPPRSNFCASRRGPGWGECRGLLRLRCGRKENRAQLPTAEGFGQQQRASPQAFGASPPARESFPCTWRHCRGYYLACGSILRSQTSNSLLEFHIGCVLGGQSSDTVAAPLALVDGVRNKAGVQQLPPSLEPHGQARFLLFQSQFYHCSRDYSFFFFRAGLFIME